MPTTCIVAGCINRGFAGGISYHRFPKKAKYLRKWLERLARERNGQPWFPNLKSDRVCSDHFQPEDFNDHKEIRNRRLKLKAVPSVLPELYQLTKTRRGGNNQSQPEQCRNEISDEPVTHITLDLDEPLPDSSSQDKDIEENILRIQKPFLEEDVMWLLKEYTFLCETLKSLKNLARINVDLLYLNTNINDNLDIKKEVDKVQELIHTLMNGKQVFDIEIVCVENDMNLGRLQAAFDERNDIANEGTGGEFNGDCGDENDYQEVDSDDSDTPSLLRRRLVLEERQKSEHQYARLPSLQDTKKTNDKPQPPPPVFHDCHFCDKKFASKVLLRRHLEKEHGDRHSYTCTICSKQFKKYLNFRCHQRRHERGDLDPQLCSICGQQCMSRPILRRHLKQHEALEKNWPQKCTLCSEEFITEDLLSLHMKNHEKDDPFTCKKCGSRFTSIVLLRQHKKEHKKTGKSACPICGKMIFVTGIKRHIRTHTGEKPFQCSMCPKSYSQSTQLKVHLSCHTGIYPHICALCGKGFHTPKLLRLHELSHKGKVLRCKVCLRQFENEISLNAHSAKQCRRSHSRIIRKSQLDKVPCPLCARPFVNAISFAEHTLRVHIEELDYCPVCNNGETFSSVHDLESHLKGVHLNEKRFKCSICGEFFLTMHRLQTHKALHTDKDALKCKVCGKLCTSTYGLKNHIILKHSDESTVYVCDICGKKLSCKANLVRHSLVHSGLKPFKCSFCGIAVSSRAALKLHTRIHTGIKKFQCEKCEKGFNDKRNYVTHLQKSHPEEAVMFNQMTNQCEIESILQF